MAWVTAIGAALSFIGSSQEKKADRKENRAMTREEALLQRQNTQFESELDYYYKQLERKEKMRGLDQFKFFSTVDNYAPDFVDTNPGPQVPEMPQFNKGIYAIPKVVKKKKKRSLFDKITDPLNIADQFGGTSYDPMGLFSSGYEEVEVNGT